MLKTLTHESKDAIEKKQHIYGKVVLKLLNIFDIDRYVVIDEYEKEKLFNIICELVEEYQLANLLELAKYIRHYGFVGMKQVNKMIALKLCIFKYNVYAIIELIRRFL